MSGIVGLWHLDDSPCDRNPSSPFFEMMAALRHRGSDARGTRIAGSMAFGCHQRWSTPEEIGERQPLVGAMGVLLVMDGRIDNRQEIIAALGQTNDASDAACALAAYESWGDRFVERIQGSFALAVFDPVKRRLILARDAVGLRPLYYWTNGRLALFASEIKAILAHPEVTAAPNEDLVADCLLLDQLPYHDDGASFFAGIWRVLPGHIVCMTPSRTYTRRYWDFDPTARTRHRTYDDYVAQFRELLMAAVKRLTRSAYPIAVAVSGGLDSACVLSVAAHLQRSGAFAAPLLPISYTPLDDPTSEENRFIALMERRLELPIKRVIPGSGGIDERLDNLWHAELPWFDPHWCHERSLFSYASERRVRVALSGLWSDQVFLALGYLVDLFTHFSWKEIVGHLREYPNWFLDVDPAYFRSRFYRELLLNLTPGPVRARIQPLRTMARAPRPRGWASRELKRRARRWRPAVRHPAYGSAHARNIYQFVHRLSHQLQIEADEKIAARFGIERALPFLDRDVVSYLMSIPGEIQTRDGVPRALLRDAMRGLVPDPILARRWRDDLGPGDPMMQDAAERGALESWSRLFFSDKLARPLLERVASS